MITRSWKFWSWVKRRVTVESFSLFRKISRLCEEKRNGEFLQCRNKKLHNFFLCSEIKANSKLDCHHLITTQSTVDCWVIYFYGHPKRWAPIQVHEQGSLVESKANIMLCVLIYFFDGLRNIEDCIVDILQAKLIIIVVRCILLPEVRLAITSHYVNCN